MDVGQAFSLGVLVGAWLGLCAMCFILCVAAYLSVKINANTV